MSSTNKTKSPKVVISWTEDESSTLMKKDDWWRKLSDEMTHDIKLITNRVDFAYGFRQINRQQTDKVAIATEKFQFDIGTFIFIQQ